MWLSGVVKFLLSFVNGQNSIKSAMTGNDTENKTILKNNCLLFYIEVVLWILWLGHRGARQTVLKLANINSNGIPFTRMMMILRSPTNIK